MKSIQTWVIVGLGVVIILMLLFDRDPPSYDTTQWKDSISKANDRIVTLQGERAKLARRIQEDSVLRHEERLAHKEDVKKKNATIAKLKANPTIIMVRDSIPLVDSLIIAQDSLIESQADRIIVLEGDVKKLGIDLAQVTDNFEATLAAMQSRIQATEQLADAYKKDARKSKRANRWLKAGAVVLGVGGLFLGAQL